MDHATLRDAAAAGAWLQEEILGEDSFIKPWMVEAANDHYILDIGRARSLLDWTPKHSLRDTLPKMIAALKRDPAGWYKENKLNLALVAWYGRRPAHTDERVEDAPPHGETAGGHDHMAMMDADEKKVRWVHYTVAGLGLWLAASPLVYDAMSTANVSDAVRAVTADRGLPSIEWRATALTISDIASGLLIALFGSLSLSKRTAWWAQWSTTFVGLWLLFAPMIFWTPSGAQYLNDMLVGSAVIALSVLIPMMPGMSMDGMMDPKSIPPGWTYSPSTFAQRLPIAYLGLIGLIISRILTAYQLGHIDGAWDPFFAGSAADPRNGTEEIITSDVSKMWPIPDAGLGAISYLLEVLMAVMGGRDRWRTMPWMVTFFGILVVPLGAVSIYFIIIQPILLGTWCTLCLLAALAMLIMIPFAVDEVVAMGQYLYWSWCRGGPDPHVLRGRPRGGRAGGSFRRAHQPGRLPARCDARGNAALDARREHRAWPVPDVHAAHPRHRGRDGEQRPLDGRADHYGSHHRHGRGCPRPAVHQCTIRRVVAGRPRSPGGRQFDLCGGRHRGRPGAYRPQPATRSPKQGALRRLGPLRRLTASLNVFLG